MSKHVATVRKFYEVFTTGDVSGFDQILAPDWQPLPTVPGNPGGRDGQKGTVRYLQSVEFHYFKNDQIVGTRHIEDFFGVQQQLLAAGAKQL